MPRLIYHYVQELLRENPFQSLLPCLLFNANKQRYSPQVQLFLICPFVSPNTIFVWQLKVLYIRYTRIINLNQELFNKMLPLKLLLKIIIIIIGHYIVMHFYFYCSSFIVTYAFSYFIQMNLCLS